MIVPTKAAHCAIVVLATVTHVSCFSYFMTSPAICVWYELDDVEGLVTTYGRPWCGDGANCDELKAAAGYRLQRAAYVVEFSTGGTCRPRVYLRVRGVGGGTVSVHGDHFVPYDASLFPEELPDGKYTHELDWRWTDGNPGEYRPKIERAHFSVLDSNGHELGRESVRVVRRTGGTHRAFQ